jgi:hypothetical protein
MPRLPGEHDAQQHRRPVADAEMSLHDDGPEPARERESAPSRARLKGCLTRLPNLTSAERDSYVT